MDRIVEPNSSRINEIRTNVPTYNIYTCVLAIWHYPAATAAVAVVVCCCRINRSSISLCYNIIVVSVCVHVYYYCCRFDRRETFSPLAREIILYYILTS